MFESLFDILINIDKYALYIVSEYNLWTYAILFVVIFIETGVVIMPFLPGDSLLFVIGSISAHPNSPLDINTLALVVLVAAILGDTCNYLVGHFLGKKLFSNKNSKFFKQKYLTNTHRFFNKYGGKTVIIARFLPIVRTFAPFVAGMGRMHYFSFMIYNIIGAFLWSVVFCYGGYLFGDIPLVQNNMKLFIIIIMIISSGIPLIEFLLSKKSSKKKSSNV